MLLGSRVTVHWAESLLSMVPTAWMREHLLLFGEVKENASLHVTP